MSDSIERPVPGNGEGLWGSDVIADLLRALDVPYLTLNPGASFRGLHDSLVNRLGNRAPQMLLCLHEESAVAIAHGWAKVTDQPLVSIVHSNVGLMHATMGVFNAWCDRAPLMLIGATGPVDAAKRRPWIDWIHTARDQAALVRPYTKWDDQPGSVAAAVESILRAWQITQAAPQGPTYVVLDVALQEQKLDKPVNIPDVTRFRAPDVPGPSEEMIARASRLLCGAARPLIFLGRVSRSESDWAARIALAEALNAVVLTDMKVAGAFPTTHPLYGAPTGTFTTPAMADLIRQADLVLALDWVDLAGTLKAAWGDEPVGAKVISVSLDQYLHNGWSMDHQGLAPVDLAIAAAPGPTVHALVKALAWHKSVGVWAGRKTTPARSEPAFPNEPLSVPALASVLRKAVTGREACLIRHPLSWAGYMWDVAHPLDFLGTDGGGGIGSGPGTAIGAALALRGSGRLPVAVLGDGDFLMGVTAIWTAAHYNIPLLIIVANNRSYFNDEVHQERVARMRERPVENKWIGQHIGEPDVDIAAMARGQGATAFGPVADLGSLERAIRDGIAAVDRGEVVVIDARVDPGYDPAMTSALTKQPDRS